MESYYYTFCNVQFKENGAAYAYLTGGIPLAVGDFVIVPVGEHGAEKLARASDVFVCSTQDAPYPPEKTKFVLRKSERTAFPERAKPQYPVPKRAVVPVPTEPASIAPPAQTAPPTEQQKPEQPPVVSQPVGQTPAEPEKPKRKLPWKWLVTAAAVAAFAIFALPPMIRETQHQMAEVQAEHAAEQEAERQRAEQERLAEEAAAQRRREEYEAAIQAQKDAGLPYIGMPEDDIDSTRTLGVHGLAKSNWVYKKTGTFMQKTYTWYTNDRTPIFTAVCRDGKVTETQKIGSYWSGNELLVQVVKPKIPTTFNSGSSSSKKDSSYGSGSTGLRDEYDSPEDLYEDNPWDYEDEDEAWDAWEND